MGTTKIAVTPGDPSGIGPEVVWKAVKKNHARWRNTPLLCIGAREPFDLLGAKIVLADPSRLSPPREPKAHIWLLEAPVTADPNVFLPGFQSGWSIETATTLVQDGTCGALVTGPIHKERLNRGGYHFSGHTDFLASLCSNKKNTPLDVTMMLANTSLRVSLVTTHCSLASVPKNLNQENITRAINQTVFSLRHWWGIRKPKIAVCALNPHAGESGLFGREEIDLIFPVIKRLQKKWGKHATLSGPFPADTLFAVHQSSPPEKRADAVIAMYHDQGLTPVKLVDFPHTVNITLGLPIIRTSVDHGTGFDIVGKNRADFRSFESATDLARTLIKKRKQK